MSFWKTLTAADVTGLTQPELAALVKYLPASANGPVSDALARAVSEVQGYIKAWKSNSVAGPGAVPPELVTATLDRARWYLISALPIPSPSTETRKTAAADALKQLRDVADGHFAITQPSGDEIASAAVQGVTGGRISVFSGGQRLSGHELRGL